MGGCDKHVSLCDQQRCQSPLSPYAQGLLHSFKKKFCSLSRGAETRSILRCSEDGVKREEAKTWTGAGSGLSELGESIGSVAVDVNSSVNASRPHAVAI
jgi:hypothetical protein